MSMLSHIEDGVRELGYHELLKLRKTVDEEIKKYSKVPNYCFEEP